MITTTGGRFPMSLFTAFFFCHSVAVSRVMKKAVFQAFIA